MQQPAWHGRLARAAARGNKMETYDLHATMPYLLGIDHKRHTYRWGGRHMRLTDVHGEVIDALIA